MRDKRDAKVAREAKTAKVIWMLWHASCMGYICRPNTPDGKMAKEEEAKVA